jgi:ABC-type dipeptide/oligopeptide/nickel transport system ATPase component
MSMLPVTHDLSVVRQMSERMIVLVRGRVVEQGWRTRRSTDPSTSTHNSSWPRSRMLRRAAAGHSAISP